MSTELKLALLTTVGALLMIVIGGFVAAMH